MASEAVTADVLYPIKRTLDYQVTQSFLVAAQDFEEAAEKVNRFAEETDWSADAGKAMGVFQIGDEMEQIENSLEILPGKDVVREAEARVDGSLEKLAIENSATEMLALLRKVASRPAIYFAPTADIGIEVVNFLAKLDALIAAPGEALAAAFKTDHRADC